MVGVNIPIISNKRDVFIIIIAFSIVIITGGYLYYRYEENSIRTNVYNELKAIANLKSPNFPPFLILRRKASDYQGLRRTI